MPHLVNVLLLMQICSEQIFHNIILPHPVNIDLAGKADLSSCHLATKSSHRLPAHSLKPMLTLHKKHTLAASAGSAGSSILALMDSPSSYCRT